MEKRFSIETIFNHHYCNFYVHYDRHKFLVGRWAMTEPYFSFDHLTTGDKKRLRL